MKEKLTVKELKERIEHSIDWNDNYTPLILLSEYMDFDEVVIDEVRRLEAEHHRIGHLASGIKIMRDGYTKRLKTIVVREKGLAFWKQFYI